MVCGISAVSESLTRRYDLVRPHLSERQRRVWLGAEARELGRSGVRVVADAVQVSPDTVRRGRDELEGPERVEVGRSRVPGGGRKRAEELQPGLAGALDQLVDPESRGDPMTPLRWTSKSLRTLATELAGQGYRVSASLIQRLLHEAGYSLQGNAKTLEGHQHADRDAQFRHIHDTVTAYTAAGAPVVSIDCKKKELVGQYKNNGQAWRPEGDPERVDVHDFLGEGGKAIPYGVYDVGANTGWVNGNRRRTGRPNSPPSRPRPACTSPCATYHQAPASEQDRAPTVLPNHQKLARQAPDHPRQLGALGAAMTSLLERRRRSRRTQLRVRVKSAVLRRL